MGFDVSGGARPRRCWRSYNTVRAQIPIDDPELLRASLDVLATFADIVRAVPEPAGRRGGVRRRAGAQPARVLPLLPAFAGHRSGGPAGGIPRPAGRGAGALRRHRSGTRAPRWRRRCTGCSWRRNGPPTRSRSSPGCWSGGATRCRASSEDIQRGGRRGRRAAGGGDPAALPGGRRPGPEHPVRGVRATADRGRPRRSVYADRPGAPGAAGRRPGPRASTRSGSQALVASPEPLIRLLAEQL